jgi:CheY-like chemotaxis protein
MIPNKERMVLVVDDDAEQRAMAASLFAELGCDTVGAGSGVEALGVLADRPEIGLLFADVRLPGMSGVALAAEARRRRPELPVTLTSGYMEALPVPGMSFVPKPWRAMDLALIAPPASGP